MPYVVNAPKPTSSTYSVTGNTLADIWADILKRGPRDTNDGTRVASVTVTEIVIDSAWAPKVRSIETIRRGSEVTYILTISVEDMRFTVTGAITVPKLGKAALSKTAKKEWDRFVAEVEKHELGHVEATRAVANAIGDEAQAMRIAGEGSTMDEALEAAKAALEKAFVKIGGPAEITKRVKSAHMKYDSSTGHGPQLKVSIL